MRMLTQRATRPPRARGITRSIPSGMEGRIVERYFAKYAEIICHQGDQAAGCIDEMVVPDTQTQIEILQQFDLIVDTYPLVDASPSLQSSLMQLLVQQDGETLERLVGLLNAHAAIVHMIQELLGGNASA